MEDTNFVIRNIRILMKFFREDIALLTSQKDVFWFCHKVWEGRIDLVQKLVTTLNEELLTVTTKF